MQKILIFTNVAKDNKLEITNRLVGVLESQNKEVWVNLSDKEYSDFDERYIELNEIKEKEIDLIIALGGDGTILGLSRKVYKYDVSVIGVNLGTIGFLAEVEVAELENIVSLLENNEYKIEDRTMIEALLKIDGLENQIIGLNDVVISRGSFKRLIEVEVFINNISVDRYKTDGIIIATPTGSTAYNLSAGGPILVPNSNMLAITPICPYGFNKRPIVVSSQDEIKIKIHGKFAEGTPMLTIDGQEGYELNDDVEIKIKKAKQTFKLVKLNKINFYELLRNKIK